MIDIELPKLNERKIARALAHIKKFPESYNQNDVADTCEITKKTPCGTIGCFGGWLMLLEVPRKERQDKANADSVNLKNAQKIAGFTDDEAEYAFASGGNDQKENYKELLYRLDQIRKARNTIEAILKLARKNINLEGTLTFITDDNEPLNYETL